MCEMPFGSAQRGQDRVCHLAKGWLCARCPEKHPTAQQGLAPVSGSITSCALLLLAGGAHGGAGLSGLLSVPTAAGLGQGHTWPSSVWKELSNSCIWECWGFTLVLSLL